MRCGRNCCSTDEDNPAPCHADCTTDHDACVASATEDNRSCLDSCASLDAHCQVYEDDDSCQGHVDCTITCNGALGIDEAHCAVEQSDCDLDCTLQNMQDQLWCGWWESYCHGRCLKTYEADGQDCLDAHSAALTTCIGAASDCVDVCDQTFDDCLFACESDPDPAGCNEGCVMTQNTCHTTCDNTLDDCNDTASDAETACLAGPTGDQFDCDVQCCTDAHGSDPAVTCYAACWHSSDCDSADSFEDCRDDFQSCLADSCPDSNAPSGYYGPDYGDGFHFATCSPCLAYGR